MEDGSCDLRLFVECTARRIVIHSAGITIHNSAAHIHGPLSQQHTTPLTMCPALRAEAVGVRARIAQQHCLALPTLLAHQRQSTRLLRCPGRARLVHTNHMLLTNDVAPGNALRTRTTRPCSRSPQQHHTEVINQHVKPELRRRLELPPRFSIVRRGGSAQTPHPCALGSLAVVARSYCPIRHSPEPKTQLLSWATSFQLASAQERTWTA